MKRILAVLVVALAVVAGAPDAILTMDENGGRYTISLS